MVRCLFKCGSPPIFLAFDSQAGAMRACALCCLLLLLSLAGCGWRDRPAMNYYPCCPNSCAPTFQGYSSGCGCASTTTGTPYYAAATPVQPSTATASPTPATVTR
jgi:hypothetical protein